MSAQDQDEDVRKVFTLLIPIIVLTIGFVIGLGVHKARKPAAKPAAQVTAPAPASDADAASVVVENGVVKFYFASGKADLAAGATEALADAIKAVAAGKKLVVSGFHDATGSPEANEELAKQRAFAVRDALKAAGVAETAVELKKPELLTGTGSNAEARRVEVVIQ